MFRPDGRALFLCLPEEKGRKERAPRVPFFQGHCATLPALLANPGARTTRDLATLDCARTGHAPDSRMGCDTRRGTRGSQSWWFSDPPSGAAEHRRPHPAQRDASLAGEPPCRAVFASRQTQQMLQVRRAPERPRSARGPVMSYCEWPGKPPGSPFFWLLFFGDAKKSNSRPKARNPRLLSGEQQNYCTGTSSNGAACGTRRVPDRRQSSADSCRYQCPSASSSSLPLY